MIIVACKALENNRCLHDWWSTQALTIQKRILTTLWETSQVKGLNTLIVLFTIVWQLLNNTIVALNCNVS